MLKQAGRPRGSTDSRPRQKKRSIPLSKGLPISQAGCSPMYAVGRHEVVYGSSLEINVCQSSLQMVHLCVLNIPCIFHNLELLAKYLLFLNRFCHTSDSCRNANFGCCRLRIMQEIVSKRRYLKLPCESIGICPFLRQVRSRRFRSACSGFDS